MGPGTLSLAEAGGLETNEVTLKTIPKKLRPAVSRKISMLMREGKSQKQAVAAALNMARAGRLGPRGGYKRNPGDYMDLNESQAVELLFAMMCFKKHRDWLLNPMLDPAIMFLVAGGFADADTTELTLAGEKLYKELNQHEVLRNRVANMEQKIISKIKAKSNPRGGYRRNPIDDKDLAPAIAFLLYLRNFPHMQDNVPNKYLDLLAAEGLWNKEEMELTEKGELFIENATSDKPRKWTK